MIVYFISISEYFATIILPELNVLFLDKFCQPIFHCKCLITCHTQRLKLFSLGCLQLWSTEVYLYHLCHIFLKGFISTCCNISFELIFTSLAFSLFTFIVWKTFFQHQCIASNFQPHNLKGIHDRLIHKLLIYNLFHNFHDNGCISSNHVSWLCFKLWLSVFSLIFVVSFTKSVTWPHLGWA